MADTNEDPRWKEFDSIHEQVRAVHASDRPDVAKADLINRLHTQAALLRKELGKRSVHGECHITLPPLKLGS